MESNHATDTPGGVQENPEVPGDHLRHVRKEAANDVAERPGSSAVSHDHADELADEWGEESFPGSDPPAHY